MMFGITRRKLTRAQIAVRTQICRAEGGYGYQQSSQGRHRLYVGWYSGPNLGDPFDRDLARRVLDRVVVAETRT